MRIDNFPATIAGGNRVPDSKMAIIFPILIVIVSSLLISRPKGDGWDFSTPREGVEKWRREERGGTVFFEGVHELRGKSRKITDMPVNPCTSLHNHSSHRVRFVQNKIPCNVLPVTPQDGRGRRRGRARAITGARTRVLQAIYCIRKGSLAVPRPAHAPGHRKSSARASDARQKALSYSQ